MKDACVVETTYGAVRGECSNGVYIWRGIPYAAAPEGELRFQPPRPFERWEGVRDALTFGAACPQIRSITSRASVDEMSEDCLTLNIWSPATDGGKRAVLFYVHGGSFQEGSGSDKEYEGVKLVSEGDVTLVTVNYRLGALGFVDFSFLGEGFEPNCGLRDIVFALRWVNENIEAFGGDPGNVTICGQSAGATCACILPGLDEARGYFRRAIMMSAVPTLLHTKHEAQTVAKMFLDFVGIEGADALRKAPAMDLAAKQEEFAQSCSLGTATFAPCVDGSFVKRFPTCAAQDGEFQGIPMLLGTTREEMSFALRRSLKHIVDINTIRRMAMESEQEETRDRIESAYGRYGKRGPGIMFSDFTFRMPCVWLAEAQSGSADTWMYRFDYESFGMRISSLHSFHSCDVPFLFGNFKVGLAWWMFLLSPFKGGIRKLHNEFRGDFLTFMKTGELPWQKCDGEDGPAKCYARPSSVEQAVPLEIRHVYDGSEFKQWSFAEEGVNLLPGK